MLVSFNSRKLIRPIVLLLFQLGLVLPMASMAQDPQLQFTQVSTLFSITDIANAGDGSRRLFLTQQSGRIYIIKNGETLEEPFLDMSDVVQSGGERGLLSVAFAPDYISSGYFYVWYTEPGGTTILARYSVSDNPDIADPASRQRILAVQQPEANHNGGRLQFGHDGLLYLGLGDGGGFQVDGGTSQDGNTLLGKLIRIDVDPSHGTYAIPNDNPFVGNGAVMDEVWATGLRNPWKISVDPETGDLFIADVGEESREEVNFQAVSSNGGENYGWANFEGTLCLGSNCSQSGYTFPVTEYTHDDGCSITGGEIYRGSAYPNLYGTYLFGDFCSGNVWGLKWTGSSWSTMLLAETNYRWMTFGLGEDGTIYGAHRSGGIFLISDGEPKSEGILMNAGLNDAWYNPVTNGQGFFITVYPDLGAVSLAWFTYDTELPPEGATASLGDPGHRWMVASGPYTGNQAVMNITMTSGGLFDTATDVQFTDPPGADGTLTLTFDTCNSGTIDYDIPSIDMVGSVPIQRVANDNIVICEALTEQ